MAYKKPEERGLEEVHLRRDKARPLSTLIFWDGQAGLHAHDCETYSDEYRQGPEPECPTEPDALKEGLKEKRKSKSYEHRLRRLGWGKLAAM